MAEKKTDVYCKNIFKHKEDEKSKKELTQKWVELINSFEKSKSITAGLIKR